MIIEANRQGKENRWHYDTSLASSADVDIAKLMRYHNDSSKKRTGGSKDVAEGSLSR